jgi:hypothetical protein
MASWKEIDRIRKDAAGARALAGRLMKIYPGEFTEWELTFLQSISDNTDLDDFTTRQVEKLLQIRDDAEHVTEYRKSNIAMLIKKCHEARLDLSEADEEWIAGLYERSGGSIRRKNVGRLFRCARELNIIEEDVAA